MIIPDNMNFRCIVCNKKMQLDPATKRTFSSPPMEGVGLTTYGNYGSAVYDLQARTEMVICDFCFAERANRMMTISYSDNEPKYIFVSQIVPKPNWKMKIKSWLMIILPPFVRQIFQ